MRKFRDTECRDSGPGPGRAPGGPGGGVAAAGPRTPRRGPEREVLPRVPPALLVPTILHLPLSPFRTRAWFVVPWWSRLPASVVRPVVLARGTQILRQNTEALARQTERIRELG